MTPPTLATKIENIATAESEPRSDHWLDHWSGYRCNNTVKFNIVLRSDRIAIQLFRRGERHPYATKIITLAASPCMYKRLAPTRS